MIKKLQLLKYLTIEDTAKHLSTLFGEPISMADVFQFALEGKLKLSVSFVNGVKARRGKVVTFDQAKKRILPRDMRNVTMNDLMTTYSGNDVLTDKLPEKANKTGLADQTLCYSYMGIEIRENEVLELENEICDIGKSEGVFDLPLIGEERLDIEQRYHMLTEGTEVTGVNLNGAFVISQDGQWYQLQKRLPDMKSNREKKTLNHPDNFHPAGCLPEDSVVVVRTSEIENFILRNSEPENVIDKPLTKSERDSLVKLVVGMGMKRYGYDPKKERNVSIVSSIKADLELYDLYMDDETILKYLKAGSEKLPAKLRNK